MNALDLQRDRIIPYRMQSAAILNLALRHVEKWPDARSMKVFFDDLLFIEGISTGFTNAAIESGIINCRALLEFLGLRAKSADQLAQRSPLSSQKGIGIEHFGLPLVDVSDVTSKYAGDAAEAETAIAGLITAANKWLAHNTPAVEFDATQIHLLARLRLRPTRHGRPRLSDGSLSFR